MIAANGVVPFSVAFAFAVVVFVAVAMFLPWGDDQ